jgi:hypothetical protein
MPTTSPIVAQEVAESHSDNATIFTPPEASFLQINICEFYDYWNKDNSNSIFLYQGKHWFLKNRPENSQEKNLNYLTYLIAKEWLNIPEVIIPSAKELETLEKDVSQRIGKKINPDAFLVRLVQDYKETEIPIKELDRAIATEIAFSAWIGRRDAHACNRAFKNGIPMFFDFGIAFGVEHQDFLRSGPDAGYAGNWRFSKIEAETIIDLPNLRRFDYESRRANIPIVSRDRFELSLKQTVDQIKALDPELIYRYALLSGLSEIKSSEISKYLQQRSQQLEETTNKILAILERGLTDPESSAGRQPMGWKSKLMNARNLLLRLAQRTH